MKKLFELGNQYVKESSWKELALVKLCLCAMGIVIGGQVAPKYRRIVTGAAAGVFILTYIPQMIKFFRIAAEKNGESPM